MASGACFDIRLSVRRYTLLTSQHRHCRSQLVIQIRICSATISTDALSLNVLSLSTGWKVGGAMCCHVGPDTDSRA